MERITQKQFDYLRSLRNRRWSVELESRLNEISEQGWLISSSEASELIKKYLEAPLKQKSEEWKRIVAEKRALTEAEEAKRNQARQEAIDKEIAECKECQLNHPVPHFNCSYPNKVGHTRHCSADLCL